jgi:hypothetical protein
MVDDAEVFVKTGNSEEKLTGYIFSSETPGVFALYAKFHDIKSESVTVTVSPVLFVKQSVALEAVATWCGYSPQMMTIFNSIHESPLSDRILTVSLHRVGSGLKSSDIDAEALMAENGVTGIPFGIMDFERRLYRNLYDIESSYDVLAINYPVTSGIAVSSRKTDNSIDVELKVKANEAGEYRVGAIIVEDNVVKTQIIYVDGNHENVFYNDSFVHHGLATFIMPGTTVTMGKYLGNIGVTKEVKETFSVSLNRNVVNRTVNYSNCRVVAYVLKRYGDKFYINNAISCPINGSVDYRYAD